MAPLNPRFNLYAVAEAIRALADAVEAGNVNGVQRQTLRRVRVALGDLSGSGCAHEHTAYETVNEVDNILICQDCREVLTP